MIVRRPRNRLSCCALRSAAVIRSAPRPRRRDSPAGAGPSARPRRRHVPWYGQAPRMKREPPRRFAAAVPRCAVRSLDSGAAGRDQALVLLFGHFPRDAGAARDTDVLAARVWVKLAVAGIARVKTVAVAWACCAWKVIGGGSSDHRSANVAPHVPQAHDGAGGARKVGGKHVTHVEEPSSE